MLSGQLSLKAMSYPQQQQWEQAWMQLQACQTLMLPQLSHRKVLLLPVQLHKLHPCLSVLQCLLRHSQMLLLDHF